MILLLRMTILLLCTLLMAPAWSARDYGLKPLEIAPDTYVLIGKREHFNFENGGNIVNTGFIVTDDGVVVIDSGPSRLYGEQLRTVIGKITKQPVVKLFNTHLHPDHILGNQAFEDIPIAALAGTIEDIRQNGEQFNDSMYRLAGPWMVGTRVVAPTETVKPGVIEIGGHRLELIGMAGHSHADLMILDHTTGVLFAADLVFHGRTPTTPHADLARWLQALEELSRIEFKLMVPGHGEPVGNSGAVIQTRDYLKWLRNRLNSAAEEGLDMAEALRARAPPSIEQLAVFHEEYQRSVAHLFPRIEADALSRGRVVQE